jgi:alpha-tubulin suppressor-like RCC1 family protein
MKINNFLFVSLFKIFIGQLGLGHTDATEKILCIKSLKFGGTGEKIILAACGRESSLVATNRGSLYVFGSNYRCQLGIESEEFTNIYSYPVKIEHFLSKMSWKQVSMGAEHTCALTNNGEVYIWGSNEDGQCGLARKYNIIRTPTKLRLEYCVTAM